MMREAQHRLLFIDNRHEAAADRGSIEVVDPSSGERLGSLARGTAPDVDRAVRAARAAFRKTWSATPAVTRGRILSRWSQRVVDHAEELALLECLDTGKPMRQARADTAALAREAGLRLDQRWL